MCTAPERDFLSVLHCGFFVEIRHCHGRNSAYRVISRRNSEENFAEYATPRKKIAEISANFCKASRKHVTLFQCIAKSRHGELIHIRAFHF